MQLFLAAIASTVVALLLAYFPPDRYGGFYPKCPFHEFLGWQCPGCGFTRACAELISGRVREAAAHNFMALAVAPFALAFAAWQSCSVLLSNRWSPLRFPQRWIAAACTAFMVFGIARNLSSLTWTAQ